MLLLLRMSGEVEFDYNLNEMARISLISTKESIAMKCKNLKNFTFLFKIYYFLFNCVYICVAMRGYVHLSAVPIEEGARSAGTGVRLLLGTKFVSFARRM